MGLVTLNGQWQQLILSGGSSLYLKGERNTAFGINKLLFSCSPVDKRIAAHVIFDPQGRTEQVLTMRAISVEIDDKYYPFTNFLSGEPEIVNGWLNATFLIPPNIWEAIKRANSIGFLFQFTYDAPVFLGISRMSLDGSKKMMAGIESSCQQQP